MHTIDHTDSHTAPLRADTTGAEPAFSLEPLRREPIWRVVGGTVASGFLGAIALGLGVHSGSAEHLISGSALVVASLAIGSVGGMYESTVSAPGRHT